MAIKITAYNANNDSSGIDLNAYFADIEINYSPVGYGYFSSGTYSGEEYATTEQPNLIPDTSKQAIVFEFGWGDCFQL